MKKYNPAATGNEPYTYDLRFGINKSIESAEALRTDLIKSLTEGVALLAKTEEAINQLKQLKDHV